MIKIIKLRLRNSDNWICYVKLCYLKETKFKIFFSQKVYLIFYQNLNMTQEMASLFQLTFVDMKQFFWKDVAIVWWREKSPCYKN